MVLMFTRFTRPRPVTLPVPLRMLIENGADVNVKQSAGTTPLHSAAQNGNLELLILLLEKGAHVDIRMEGGKLPADLAREKGL
jgi:ankyrin repeat protein